MKRVIFILGLLLTLFPIAGCNFCGVCSDRGHAPNTQFLVEWECRGNIQRRVVRSNNDGTINVPNCERIRRIA